MKEYIRVEVKNHMHALYIQLEDALFQESDKFTVRVAETVDDAVKLLETGFEYVTDWDDKKLFRKRQ